jgi:hypothetical protein
LFESRKARQARALVLLMLLVLMLAVGSFYAETFQPVHSVLSFFYHIALGVRTGFTAALGK